MADGDAGHGYGDSLETVGVRFSMKPDLKSQKETDAAIGNVISLIADLSIIGTVAGKVLGKMWEGMQESIDIGISEFKDISSALNFDVEPKDFLALKFALSQVGVEGDKANSILSEMDEIIYRFSQPGTGPSKISEVIGKLAKAGVQKDDLANIQTAIDSKDPMELMKAFIATREALGSEFSNVITDLKLPELANLEQIEQIGDFLGALDMSGMKLFDVDTAKLDALSDGAAKLDQAAKSLKTAFAEDVGPSVEDLGDKVLKLTEAFLGWHDAYKEETATELEIVDKNMKESTILREEGKINIFQDAFNSFLGFNDWFNGILPGNYSEKIGTTAYDAYGFKPNFEHSMGNPEDWNGIIITGDVYITAENKAQLEAEILGVGRGY